MHLQNFVDIRNVWTMHIVIMEHANVRRVTMETDTITVRVGYI